jgi:hypothetical protein
LIISPLQKYRRKEGNYSLTTANAATNTGNDQNDSDASTSGSNAVIAFTTGAAGATNHTLDFGFQPPVCLMNISNVLVSDCFQQAGASKTAVQITVNWTNGVSNDSIKVTVGGVDKFIKPTSAGSPQMIQFVVDANGSMGNSIAAAFTTSATCSATSTFNAPAACPPDPCADAGNLGGKAWIDYNMNGVKDANDAQNLAGVTVNIYDCNNNLVGTDVTDANGDWYKSGLAFGGATDKYRVEYTNIPPQYKSSFEGVNSKSTVQFVSAATCNVDLGISKPVDYCQTNPNIVLTCFAVGDPTVAGTTAGIDAIVTFPYIGSVDHTPSPTHEVYAGSVGAVWGVAFQRDLNQVFSAAFVKRHSGLGSLGTGGIYITDFTNPARPTSPFLDLSSLAGTVGARDLTNDPLIPSRDTFAFNLNGKRGLGDLDMSEDGKTLWTVNLNSNTLIKIDIANYVATGTLPTLANVTSFPIPNVAGCPTSDNRPMGLGIKGDQVFVTNTCSGESTQSYDDLKTVVYRFDPTSTTFTQVADLKLNYRRGFLNSASGSPTFCEVWQPWTRWSQDFLKYEDQANTDWPCYAQPVGSDIVFDNDGTMILAIMDRSGHQLAYNNYSPIAPDTRLYSAVTGGDILRFTPQSNGQFIVESGGVSGSKTGSGANNKEGPGGGEFYGNDGWITTQPWEQHHETAFGALMFVPGSSEVGVTRMDPLNNTGEYGTGGVGWYSNIDGGNARGNGYNVYPLGGFGKGNGLGSLESMCNPAPLQVGNYVWIDTDKDGVQDPCEGPLSNVALSLWKNGVQIATTTTDANGNYAFTGIGAPNETWTATSGTDSILPNMAYEVRISTTQTNIATPNYGLTTANNTANNGNDQNDSDATLAGTDALIAFTTGATGSTNHTLDFGFRPICIPPTITTVGAETATCTNGVANSNAAVAVRGIAGMTKYGYNTTGGTGLFALNATASTLDSIRVGGLANPSVATTYTFRIWGIDTTCYNDTTVVLNPQNCVVVKTCTGTAPANNDFELGTTTNPAPFAGGIRYELASGGSLTSWDTATAKGNDYRVKSPMAASGDYFVYIYSKGTTATGDDACLQQLSIPVLPNTKYVICAYAADAKADGKPSGVALEVQEKNAGGGDAVPFHYKIDTLSDNINWRNDSMSLIPWTLHTYKFTTSSTTTNINLWLSASAIGGDTSFVALDMACLQIVPLPTIVSVAADAATCTNGVANSDAKVAVRGIVGMAKYAYGTNGTTGLFAANATASTLDSIQLTGLTNPSVSRVYTFRIYATDTTCYNDTTVTLTPSVCPPCSITATLTQGNCNSNGTTITAADDYFTVAVTAVSATNGGTSGKYEVVLNGTTVLNAGGTNYGTSVTVGTTTTFKSDGATTYNLTVRDLDQPTCVTTVFTTVVSASCSVTPCPATICLPVTVTRN